MSWKRWASSARWSRRMWTICIRRQAAIRTLIRELHGNMQMLVCLNCRERYPIAMVKEKYADSDNVPTCEYCRGILKPDVIFFGEALPQQTLAQAMREAEECDLMMVIGSSLVVYPAAYVPVQAKQAGADLVIINKGPTEQDHHGRCAHRCRGGRDDDENNK